MSSFQVGLDVVPGIGAFPVDIDSKSDSKLSSAQVDSSLHRVPSQRGNLDEAKAVGSSTSESQAVEAMLAALTVRCARYTPGVDARDVATAPASSGLGALAVSQTRALRSPPIAHNRLSRLNAAAAIRPTDATAIAAPQALAGKEARAPFAGLGLNALHQTFHHAELAKAGERGANRITPEICCVRDVLFFNLY